MERVGIDHARSIHSVAQDTWMESMRLKYYLGIDPDTHTTALALMDHTKRLVAVDVLRADTYLLMAHSALYIQQWLANTITETQETERSVVAIIEGQESYLGPGKKHAKPQDLINLAFVSGACAAACYESPTVKEVINPLPKSWKGSVPKKIHQEHTCRKLGWSFRAMADYVIPTDYCHFANLLADWKHLMDAVGLALWACEKNA